MVSSLCETYSSLLITQNNLHNPLLGIPELFPLVLRPVENVPQLLLPERARQAREAQGTFPTIIKFINEYMIMILCSFTRFTIDFYFIIHENTEMEDGNCFDYRRDDYVYVFVL